MLKVERSRYLASSPEAIYNTLTQPETLAAVVKRIEKAEIIERDGNIGKIALTLDLPARKTAETTGEVEGTPFTQIIFRSLAPFPLEVIWNFQPENDGTQVNASMGVDLKAYIGIIPEILVRGLIAAELDADLERLESWMQNLA